jgi:hypothetical protein
MSGYSRSSRSNTLTTLSPRTDYDDNFDDEDYDDDISVEDAAEVEAALNTIENQFDNAEDALTQWSRNGLAYSNTPSSRLPALSTISERTENFSSRPTSHAFSATRPVSITSDAFRRSGQFIGPSSPHSRASTDPGTGGQPPSPSRPSSRRAGELIAFFEDKAAAPSGDQSVIHVRAASAPGFPRPTTPAASRSRPASPAKSRSSQASTNSASASLRSLLSPPALKALTSAPPEPWAYTTDTGRSYTSGYGSGTDTRGYTTDTRTFTGTDTRTFTGTDAREYDTRTPTRTYDTDAQSDGRSFTSDTRGYTTDTLTHTRGFTSPESRSLTYNTEGRTTTGNTNTFTDTTFTTQPDQVTPTLRRTAPHTSVRNIVAAWKERTPSTRSSGSAGDAGDVVGRVLSIRRSHGGSGRRSERASSTTPSTTTSEPGFNIDELREYAKGSREVRRLKFSLVSACFTHPVTYSQFVSASCGTSTFMPLLRTAGNAAKPFFIPT